MEEWRNTSASDYPSPLKDAVLDTAARLFSRPAGLQRTTLEEIAHESSVELASLMARFPSVDHLAASIFEKVFSNLPAELSEVRGQPAEDRLLVFLVNDLSMLDPYRGFVSAMTAHAANPLSPSFFLLSPLVARYSAYVAEEIRVARQRDEVSRWVVPSLAAGAFWVLRMAVLRFWISDESVQGMRTVAYAHRMVRAFVSRLGGTPTPLRRHGGPSASRRSGDATKPASGV